MNARVSKDPRRQSWVSYRLAQGITVEARAGMAVRPSLFWC